MANTKTTTGGLNFTYPAKGRANFSALFDVLWGKISSHNHEGGGKGLQLTGNALQDASITAIKIKFANDEFITATDNAGTGVVNILKVNTSDAIELGAALTMLHDTYLSAIDNAGTGLVNLLKANTSDQIEVGAPVAVLELAHNLFQKATDNAGTGTVDMFKINTNDKLEFGTNIAEVLTDSLKVRDTNDSNDLHLKWNEDDTGNRILNFLVNGANRNLNLSGNLTVEANSTVNQDLSTDAKPAFNGIDVGSGGITSGLESAPSAGDIGELKQEDNSTGVSLTNNVPSEVDQITLTAGVWEIFAVVEFSTTGTVSGNLQWLGAISASSGSLGDIGVGNHGLAKTQIGGPDGPKPIHANNSVHLRLGPVRTEISSNTTYYVNCRGFATGSFTNVTAKGEIRAIRVA